MRLILSNGVEAFRELILLEDKTYLHFIKPNYISKGVSCYISNLQMVLLVNISI